MANTMEKYDKYIADSIGEGPVEPGYCHCGCGLPTKKMRDGTYFSYRRGHHPLEIERRKRHGLETPNTPQRKLERTRTLKESWREAELSRLESEKQEILPQIQAKDRNPPNPERLKKREKKRYLLINEVLLERYAVLHKEYSSLGADYVTASEEIEFTVQFVKRIWGADTSDVKEICDRLNQAINSSKHVTMNLDTVTVEKTTDLHKQHINPSYTDAAHERLQERYIQLLDAQRALKAKYEILCDAIAYAILFIQTTWSADKEAVDILSDRLNKLSIKCK